MNKSLEKEKFLEEVNLPKDLIENLDKEKDEVSKENFKNFLSSNKEKVFKTIDEYFPLIQPVTTKEVTYNEVLINFKLSLRNLYGETKEYKLIRRSIIGSDHLDNIKPADIMVHYTNLQLKEIINNTLNGDYSVSNVYWLPESLSILKLEVENTWSGNRIFI